MSGARGTVRKVFDKGPAALTTTGLFDGSTGSTSWSSGLTNYWLTDLSQSTADNGRVGFSIAAESLDLRIQITPDPTVVGFSHLRMLLFADNECDGSLPTYGEVLGSVSSASSVATVATGATHAFLQPAYFGRFQVYEDKHWIWYNSSTQNSFMENQTHPIWHESHHDLKSHRIQWDTSDNSAIANARKGHLFLFFVYSNTETATGGIPTVTTANPPTIQLATRMRYRDA